ncbi:hypothetical protein ANCCEY_12422 [Ancylostoma ceylanicum]|uniref:Uncharacterized protein n=1 Tax=Ancylostoma ceylanicum TaxID=53326 RepID=A0A0D6L9A8_9BILA|nr:hypothetical protein ANCCEY_12422 [Ancylostoma ceylanicum]
MSHRSNSISPRNASSPFAFALKPLAVRSERSSSTSSSPDKCSVRCNTDAEKVSGKSTYYKLLTREKPCSRPSRCLSTASAPCSSRSATICTHSSPTRSSCT